MSIRIVVADDDRALNQCLCLHLERAGYQVQPAYDGVDALFLSVKQRPDLLILDVCMPKLDGRDILARLKRDPEFKHMPIIVFTQKDSIYDRTLGMDLGADEYFGKPFGAEELLQSVRRLVGDNSE